MHSDVATFLIPTSRGGHKLRILSMLNRLVVRKCKLLFLISLLPLSASAAVVLQGDADVTTGQTFTFPVSAHVSSPDGYYLYMGASGGTANAFAVNRNSNNSNKIIPMVPQKIKLNDVADQINPLYNGAVQYLGLLASFSGPSFNPVRQENPIVVLSTALTALYIIDTYFFGQLQVESVTSINDAAGNPDATIVGVGNVAGSFAVAAVTNGTFGDVTSGLAFLALQSIQTKEGETQKLVRTLVQIDAPTGGTTAPIRSLPLNVNSSALMITDPLASITDNVVMHWDERLNRLYVGLSVTAGGNATDGGFGVAIISPAPNNAWTIVPIAPATVLGNTPPNEIIGGIGAGTQVTINNIKTMGTSTNFSYLIVQGGNGAPDSATNQTVFALPLVNSPTNPAINGTIADKTQTPNLLQGTFSQPAITQPQMTIATDDAAIVGGGSLAAGPIEDMFVRGDAVFVTVLNAIAPQLPGVFYSQAIFDNTGKVSTWSQWQRADGSVDSVIGATLDNLGDFTTMTGAGQIVKRTQWGTNDGDGLLGGPSAQPGQGLISVIGAQLPQAQAGVQGLFDFPASTPGLINSSLLVATGLNTVVLAETGQVIAGVITPDTGDFLTDMVTFNNGEITQTLPGTGAPKVVTISGGALNNIGPIVSAEIAVGGTNGYLFVGGIGGLAVLANTNSIGWNATTGVGPNFAGLTAATAPSLLTFQTVGNYSFVRKLVADGTRLYVMTDTQLDAIDLADFVVGAPTITSLATISSALGVGPGDTFIDVAVSGKFALLATSKGLMRVGNGSDISAATNQTDVGWTSVTLPESVGPVTQILPVTITGRAQDFADAAGTHTYSSNVCVLNAYVGYDLGQVARFTCKDISASVVDDTTLQLIPNYFVVNIPAPIINYNGFRDVLATDGASFLSGLSRKLQQDPFVQILFGLKRGVRNIFSSNTNVPLTLNSASRITNILRDSASGSWLVGGDFGLQVNE